MRAGDFSERRDTRAGDFFLGDAEFDLAEVALVVAAAAAAAAARAGDLRKFLSGYE